MQAFRILREVGERFASDQDTDRVLAFENYARDLAKNIAILSMSRAMSLEGVSRTIAQIHSMIGAPKKKTETKEEEPLEALASWLNGESVAGFPEDEPDAVESPAEDVAEESDSDGPGESSPVPEPIA